MHYEQTDSLSTNKEQSFVSYFQGLAKALEEKCRSDNIKFSDKISALTSERFAFNNSNTRLFLII